jgi:Mn-dependent DtxR family transcriptional regulator
MRILWRLSQGGRYSNKLMAMDLGVDEATVEQMIEQLKNLKYIEKDDMGNCSSGCGGCSVNHSCSSKHSGVELNLWKLTEKGRNAVSRMH